MMSDEHCCAVPSASAAFCCDCEVIYNGSRRRTCPACGSTASAGLTELTDRPRALAASAASICLGCWSIHAAARCPRCGGTDYVAAAQLLTARARVRALTERTRRSA